MRVTDPCGDHSLMKTVQRLASDADFPSRRENFTGQKLGKGRAFELARRLDPNAGSGRNLQRDVFKYRVAVAVAHSDIIDRNRAVEMRDTVWLSDKKFFFDHAAGRETFGHDFPTQRHILHLVVIGQKLFPRRAQVFVGCKSSNKCAHRDLSTDRQHAPNRVKEEWRELRDEVVEKLHEEFLLVDLEPDMEQPAQSVRENRQPVAPPAICPQISDPGRRFSNLGGECTNLNDPLFVQLVNLALQHGNEPCLQRNKCDTCQPEPDALRKQKDNDDEHLPGLKHRLRDRIPHQAAHGLCFRCHHGNKLALAGRTEIGVGKAHHPSHELESETPQQSFGQNTLHRVQAHLQKPMRQNRSQIERTEDQQEVDLRDIKPVPDLYCRFRSPDRVVDDPLGQFQRGVEKREGEQREKQQKELLSFGVLPNERKDRGFHKPAFAMCPLDRPTGPEGRQTTLNGLNLGVGLGQYKRMDTQDFRLSLAARQAVGYSKARTS